MQMPQDYSMPSRDVFVIDAERWAAAVAEDGYPQQSPQLVVEVISLSNTKKNVNRKTALYLKNGACGVWIVYPHRKTVQVFTPTSDATFAMDEALPLPLPLPSVNLALKDIFDLTPLAG